MPKELFDWYMTCYMIYGFDVEPKDVNATEVTEYAVDETWSRRCKHTSSYGVVTKATSSPSR
jgi:hypothetical protein